jgi:copper(I)-binding protein
MRRVALVLAGLVLSASARADVKLENAWLRPAYAGQASAMVYVDIESTRALKLVGATSPVAGSAELVLVEPPGADPPAHKVVRDLPVAANKATRLAYLGSHVRLLDIRKDLKPGDAVPITLTFADGSGKRETRTTEAKVRGITARKPANQEFGVRP